MKINKILNSFPLCEDYDILLSTNYTPEKKTTSSNIG
jgi:hypothetical protein